MNIFINFSAVLVATFFLFSGCSNKPTPLKCKKAERVKFFRNKNLVFQTVLTGLLLVFVTSANSAAEPNNKKEKICLSIKAEDCKKGDLIYIQPNIGNVADYCDITKNVIIIPPGKQRALCYYIGYKREKRR